MRECYKFHDDKTEIHFGSFQDMGNVRYVSVVTKDENGTQIEMTRYADELVDK